MSHFPPPPPLPPKLGWCQRVPPAIFPPILGLFGLGLAWRRGVGSFDLSPNLVELFLGAVTLLFLFSFMAYAVKIMRSSEVVGEDLRTLPGRTGLAAMTMCIMLLAAVLTPYMAATATILLILGFAGHLWLALTVLRRLLTQRESFGPMTAALQLVFVGFIVAPAAALPLGVATDYLPMLVWYSLVASLLICARTLPPLIRGDEPAPLRPLQAIHLAPAALVASGAILTGQDILAQIMLIWACVLFVIFLWRGSWLIEAGFSGFWSAFTFPLAAFAGVWFLVHAAFGWDWARILGGLLLILATLIIPPIAFRVLKLWANGELAAKTNAAIA